MAVINADFFFGEGGGVVFLIKKILMHETLDNKIFQIHFQSLTDLHVLCFFFFIHSFLFIMFLIFTT